jgi:hypothetical protein
MLSGKRILVAEDNDWIAAELVQTIADHRGIALGPAPTNISAFALIDEHPDGAILDGNLLDGPITPVARAPARGPFRWWCFRAWAFPPSCNDRTRIFRSSSSHHPMRLSFARLPSASRSALFRQAASETCLERVQYLRSASGSALSDDRISRIEDPARATLPDTQIRGLSAVEAA